MSQISSTSAPPQLQKHKASAWELAQNVFQISYTNTEQDRATSPSAHGGPGGAPRRCSLPAPSRPHTHLLPFVLQFP